MEKKKKDYISVNVEFIILEESDIVTASNPNDASFGNEGNFDSGGWT